jgi:hypothetical protein
MVKQPANVTPYPTMVVKANSTIGVAADVSGASPGGAGWVTIGPLTVNPSSDGPVWVEIRNNCQKYDPTGSVNSSNILPWMPCYFDHLQVT